MGLIPGANVFSIYFALTLLIWAAFGHATGYPFVNYDDGNYVYENPQITGGLTVNGFIAAFTQSHARNWHPITTISHMLDCQLFGLNAAGHHLVNVLLHLTAALLLFSVLNAATAQVWRSAFVAAVFAIHPLRAESVAWIAERKDVLSGVFFVLTLGAYVRYVRARSPGRYLTTLGFFMLGLMSKPTLVTLPLLLLLLDFWPLERLCPRNGSTTTDSAGLIRRTIATLNSSVVLEKIPFLILSIITAVITITVQSQTVAYGGTVPFAERFGNSLVSYATYVGQMVWPANLTVFYPEQSQALTTTGVISAAMFLLAITVVALVTARKRRFVAVGWAWYLISLLPMIGLVKVGLQARADRYTYLPQIGLAIAATWGAVALPGLRSVRGRRVLAITAMVVVAILTWRAAIQTSYWETTESLWKHALAVDGGNVVAHYNVAGLLLDHGQINAAIDHYLAALRAVSPTESHDHFSRALLENGLGNALAQKGELDAAIIHYREALNLRPNFPDARSNLAAMFFRKGDIADAISEYEKVVGTPPEDAVSHQRLAGLLVKANRREEAIRHYSRAITIAPDSLEPLKTLAWLYATSPEQNVRDADQALSLARRANELSHGRDPGALRIVGAAYAALGRKDEAVTAAEHALSLTPPDTLFAHELHQEIEVYRAGRSKISASSTDF
jgi:tetratricopeptide (TPR) repeat protein